MLLSFVNLQGTRQAASLDGVVHQLSLVGRHDLVLGWNLRELKDLGLQGGAPWLAKLVYNFRNSVLLWLIDIFILKIT